MTAVEREPAVIRLANDISRQFAHLPHPAAAEEVSAHLLKFWEPRLRIELRRRIAEHRWDLHPEVIAAVMTWPDEEHTPADRHEPSGG